jgi:hypothetical protein
VQTQTQELFRRLDQVTWFAAVGQPVEGLPRGQGQLVVY